MSTETPGPDGIGRATVPPPRVGADGLPDRTAAPTRRRPCPARTTGRLVLADLRPDALPVDRRRGWDKLPLPGGLAVLMGVRTI